MALSQSVQRVKNALAKSGMRFEVVEMSSSTLTAEDAASAIGCSVGQIVKSLIFSAQITQKPILVLASGINRVSEQAMAEIIGFKISKADPRLVREVTGFAIGGVPPVGHEQEIETYIDQDLLKFDELWAAAGTPFAVFKLNPKELQKLTKGKVVSIT